MKIVVLSDHRHQDELLAWQHGLSVCLETELFCCLLDTGASGQFIRNAERLGIEVKDQGLLEILDSVSLLTGAKIGTVLGGFHLPDSEQGHQFEMPADADVIAPFLKRNYPETKFIAGHCTGLQRVFLPT